MRVEIVKKVTSTVQMGEYTNKVKVAKWLTSDISCNPCFFDRWINFTELTDCNWFDGCFSLPLFKNEIKLNMVGIFE